MGKDPCLCLEREKEGREDCLFRKTRENAGRICLLLLRYRLGAPEFVTPATQGANAEWGQRIQRRKGMLRSRVIGAPSTSYSCYKEQRGWPTPVEASQSFVADRSFMDQCRGPGIHWRVVAHHDLHPLHGSLSAGGLPWWLRW